MTNIEIKKSQEFSCTFCVIEPVLQAYRIMGVVTAARAEHRKSPQERDNYLLGDYLQKILRKIRDEITLCPFFYSYNDIFKKKNESRDLNKKCSLMIHFHPPQA